MGCGWAHIDLDGDVFATGGIPNSDAIIRTKLIHHNVKFPHGCLVFRKKALDRSGGYDTRFRYTQDLDLLLRMANGGYVFGAIEEPLYKLRKRLEPNDLKQRCQERYRALAYERFSSDREVEIPDVLSEVQAFSGNSVSSRRVRQAHYWYAIGMSALADGRRKQFLKCLIRSYATGDVRTSLKFTARLVLGSLRMIRNTGRS